MERTLFDVFTQVADKTGEAKDQKIGRAFKNREGEITVFLDAIPTNGKMTLK